MTTLSQLYIHPYIRLSFLFLGIASAVIIDSSPLLVLFYITLVLPVLILSGSIKRHLNLLFFGIMPIALSFILLYILILNESNGGWEFIAIKVSKIVLFTSIFQFSLIIQPEILIVTFRNWGLKGESLITLLGAFTVWADVNYRADKIITARFSRGFVKKRTIVNKIRQFPFVMVPLVIGVIRTSIERAESWNQKNIVELINHINTEQVKYPMMFNAYLLGGVVSWLIVALYFKLNGIEL